MYLPNFDTQLTIETHLSVHDAEALLKKNVGGLLAMSRPFGRYLFTGIVSDGYFKMSRVGSRYNVFIPTITGEFHDDQGTTQIELHIHPKYIEMSIFFLSISTVFVFYLSASFITLLFMLLMALAMVIGNGHHEVRQAQQILEKLFLS